ncbi:tRNA (adenosine(37)-N6)-dimethylallyltransferase MiaA [Desertivirga xinjiangensis]|uniref:tRNA (adenosine(37)-N6)-dimethylallyltransferase MiaA n=1 Tax=Desertivirga xinjiangensis TaxID=539206 RepID=UPI00210BDA8D|nr:tRNA (adenosine(37)-N6)-dimethylallyltransferase MiaA [Pedobacter xinjiangensis]
MDSPKTLIVIAGPTAIGKTDLAIKLALHYKTEIISADSRQFYREMTLGTAKPSDHELAQVKHHFINSHSIDQPFSVGDFETEVLTLLDELFKLHDIVILVGGSGLFIKAITEGFDVLPKADMAIRENLNKLFAEHGIKALQEKLLALDPGYYQEVDLNNPQRLIRALEVCISSGFPFSSYRKNAINKRNFNSVKICLNTDRETLYSRINLRVDQMIENGLIDEVKSLVPYQNLNALNTVGYTEVFQYLKGEITLTEAVESIKQNTRRFAKRQLTWFRKDSGFAWFEPCAFSEILEYIYERTRL